MAASPALGELFKAPTEGHKTEYRYYSEPVTLQYGDNQKMRSHWLLMTKDVIPGSRNKTYADQTALVTELGLDYRVPSVLDAAVCVLMEDLEMGVRLFSDAPWTYTRCLERVVGSLQLVIGAFASTGLDVDKSYFSDINGVAAARKF